MNIKEYWDSRAGKEGTTDDAFLRQLEFQTLAATIERLHLPVESMVLDVGCGDGETTKRLAGVFPGFHWYGIDFSLKMILVAVVPPSRVNFTIGDVTEIEGDYDLIISDRCLINLESGEAQAVAIAEIARHVKPGGYFIAIENFIEGHDDMNRAREAVGLPEIPVRWHNHYFTEERFVAEVEDDFDILEWVEFASSYYFATRVVAPAACGEFCNDMAMKLPPFGKFGPVRMAVMYRWN